MIGQITQQMTGRMTHQLAQALDEATQDRRGFEFVGFEPSQGLASRAMERMSRVFGESPSDSATFASLSKTSEGFSGTFKIHSAVGTFVADVIGEDPLQVVNVLSRKIRSQLRLWKRHRTLALENF